MSNQTPLITVTPYEGLGSVMFKIAAAYTFGRAKGYQLVLNKDNSPYKDTIFKHISNVDNQELFHILKEKSFNYRPLSVDGIEGFNIMLEGQFQSYKYSNNYHHEIRNLFTYPVESKYDPTNKVSIHVRRSNYLNTPNQYHNLSIDYYLNAIDYFKGSEFLVFSDDIEWCKENFKGEEFTFVENTSDIHDLYLMSLCKHNIIANSTFSWWGAFLNTSRERVVVCPDKWFGPANSDLILCDLYPEDWICLTEAYPKMTVNLVDNAFAHLEKSNGRYSSVHQKIASKVKFVRDVKNFDGVTLFTDLKLDISNVKEVKSKYKIGWLIEPKAVLSLRYGTFEGYIDELDFVITHNKELLEKYPDKTKATISGGTWIRACNYGIYPKIKNISMIYSDKQWLEGHRLRHQVANIVTGVDFYGGAINYIRSKEEALVDYRFSIVIENFKTDNNFTEKLLDCLLTGTIPIYWGCPNVGEYFDTRGMIIADTFEEIISAVETLTEKDYIDRIEYVKENFNRAKNYAVTEDWIYENILKHLPPR